MLYEEHNKIIADFSRQRVTKKTLEVRPRWGPLLLAKPCPCPCSGT